MLKGVKIVLNTFIIFTKTVIFIYSLFNIFIIKFKKIFAVLNNTKDIIKTIITFIIIIKYIYAAMERRFKNQ